MLLVVAPPPNRSFWPRWSLRGGVMTSLTQECLKQGKKKFNYRQSIKSPFCRFRWDKQKSVWEQLSQITPWTWRGLQRDKNSVKYGPKKKFYPYNQSKVHFVDLVETNKEVYEGNFPRSLLCLQRIKFFFDLF